MHRHPSGCPLGPPSEGVECRLGSSIINTAFPPQKKQMPMRAAWYGLCTDCLHNEWRDGRAVSATIWNPHWIRVAEEDGAMKIGPWVARKRKAFWEARFAVAVANCNASMISRSQHITD